MMAEMLPRWVITLALLAAACLLAAGGRRIRPATPTRAAARACPRAGEAGRTLTVTFWNVEWFPGRRPDAGDRAQASHVAAVVPVVERLDPDVLGLEEVADADAAHLIADHLKGFRVDVCTEFTRAPANEPSRQQIVLCSRLPLLAGGWEHWRPAADGLVPRRGFAFAAYRPRRARCCSSTGCTSRATSPTNPAATPPTSPCARNPRASFSSTSEQGGAVCARWGRVRLAVVGGDMNTSLDDGRFEAEATLRAVAGRGRVPLGVGGRAAGRRFTLPGEGRYPAVCFDHVFYRARGRSGWLDAHCATGRTASDHRPVTARFAW